MILCEIKLQLKQKILSLQHEWRYLQNHKRPFRRDLHREAQQVHAIALPVRTVDEVKSHLEVYQKKYYDARHVCYAYMLGSERKDFRANDNGEPSGTQANRSWDR